MATYTTKIVQSLPHFEPKQLSKALCVTRKCRQSAFLFTKMHFASLSPTIFFLIVGMGGWISSVDFGYCMSAFCFIVKHLAVMNRFLVVFQMHDYVFQLSSVRRVVHPPPYHLKNYQVSNLPASCILDSYLVDHFWEDCGYQGTPHPHTAPRRAKSASLCHPSRPILALGEIFSRWGVPGTRNLQKVPYLGGGATLRPP